MLEVEGRHEERADDHGLVSRQFVRSAGSLSGQQAACQVSRQLVRSAGSLSGQQAVCQVSRQFVRSVMLCEHRKHLLVLYQKYIFAFYF